MTCGRSPPQASHRWRPGGFDRVPGPSLLGRGRKLKRNPFCALRTRNPGTENGCRSFCRRWRQTALRSDVVDDVNKPKMTPKCDPAPVVKPRLSPESRGFGSPSTLANTDGRSVVESRLTDEYPYVALHTAKIHTLITLVIGIRTKALVSRLRTRRPCGFDSHRPLHFQASSGYAGLRDWGQDIDPVEKCWECASIWGPPHILRHPYVAPAFTRTVTRSNSQEYFV
jgi:hypothetical protein